MRPSLPENDCTSALSKFLAPHLAVPELARLTALSREERLAARAALRALPEERRPLRECDTGACCVRLLQGGVTDAELGAALGAAEHAAEAFGLALRCLRRLAGEPGARAPLWDDVMRDALGGASRARTFAPRLWELDAADDPPPPEDEEEARREASYLMWEYSWCEEELEEALGCPGGGEPRAEGPGDEDTGGEDSGDDGCDNYDPEAAGYDIADRHGEALVRLAQKARYLLDVWRPTAEQLAHAALHVERRYAGERCNEEVLHRASEGAYWRRPQSVAEYLCLSRVKGSARAALNWAAYRTGEGGKLRCCHVESEATLELQGRPFLEGALGVLGTWPLPAPARPAGTPGEDAAHGAQRGPRVVVRAATVAEAFWFLAAGSGIDLAAPPPPWPWPDEVPVGGASSGIYLTLP